ncbi:hypothetical protein TPHA_0E03860 [Tetrapisispora phaffii CBS 4417]|uniref:RNA polymerase II-associated protein RBA50 n=1 Tax=Tetrapisispora phaffii (strain ATCC 24235 / CBS 4417 / NBRC 1672 / NRRL Y-8282 / UCD 70-5) TaxID=1071381 RepID=G8BU97_TETPH|nr:hypothetical protein TPHA_0E03860 [Tetrapisispora phaffii CBS 4417]CCE63475.1 hypothetical protein TPHA_0E03860 [Tetrapisispora phaffii CBS 4417]
MDLLGEIVEKNLDDDHAVGDVQMSKQNANNGGFPELYKPEKISSWRQRLKAKGQRAWQNAAGSPSEQKLTYAEKVAANEIKGEDKPVSEVKSIHDENINRLKNMNDEEIMRERMELFESLDPKLIQKLLKNMNKRSMTEDGTPIFAEIEGAPGTWVGGTNDLHNLPTLSGKSVEEALGTGHKQHSVSEIKPTKVEKQEDVQDYNEDDDNELLYEDEVDDIAPLDFQLAQNIDHMTNEELMSDVHFVREVKNDSINKDNEKLFEKLDINDPEFNSKLHEKYFPDLPKDISKLKWMESVTKTEDGEEIGESSSVIEDVTQLRFDFKGNLIPPSRKIENTTQSALHHHSQDPQLAGYTIPELARLTRSTFPQQRSISIQVLGRILYKLGKQSYYQLIPEIDQETYQEHGSTQGVINKIYSMIWDLCKDCQVIESLEDAADERKTSHLTVRNYAIEALWLWKNGGGDFRAKHTETKTD